MPRRKRPITWGGVSSACGNWGPAPSLLNPLWYAGSFAIGALAATFGDATSLGFVAETERQVEGHLEEHLRRLPSGDTTSRAVVNAMRSDEIEHASVARAAARAELPALVRRADAWDRNRHDADCLLDLSCLQFFRLMYKNVTRAQALGDLDMDENVKPLSDIPAINRFLSYCRIRTVPSKTVVIHAGDLPDVLYYIISGSVEVMIEDEEGNEMVLAYLNKGPVLRRNGPVLRAAHPQCLGPHPATSANWPRLTYPRFRQIAAESPGLIFELATQLATRLDRTNRKLGDLAFVDVTGRVAHAIMDLCGEPDALTPSGGHADQGQPSGALAPGGLFARDGGPSTEGPRGPGFTARHGQDHRGLQCPSEDQDPSRHRSRQRQAGQCAPGARRRER